MLLDFICLRDDVRMARPTLDQLEVLLAVAEAGSFSAAAKRLRRAQSAVSYAIGELERLLDVVLFDRTRYRPQLTATGEVLLATARTVLGDMQHLEAAARASAIRAEPRVEIVVDAIFPPWVLQRAAQAFAQRYPSTELIVRTESRLTLLQLLNDGIATLGVCAQPTKLRTGLARRALRTFDAVAVAAPTHPLFAAVSPIPTRALRRHVQLILTERDARARRADGDAVSGGASWRVTDVTTKHAWLVAGLGWGFMPMEWIDADLRENRLRRLALADHAEIRGTFYAVYPAAKPPGPASTYLVERLQ